MDERNTTLTDQEIRGDAPRAETLETGDDDADMDDSDATDSDSDDTDADADDTDA